MGQRETKKEQMFKALFESNYDKLYYAALVIVNDEEEARNIVDDMFASLWEKFDPQSHTYNSSYLHKVVKHRSLDYKKKIKIREQYAESYRLSFDEQMADYDIQEERLKTIENVMAQMSRQTKFVLDQCYMEGKKYTEVADMLGITRDGVKKHIMKGLKMMRDAFGVKKE